MPHPANGTQIMHDRPTLVDDRQPTESTSDPTKCEFCDQRVATSETVPVSLGDGREREVCEFCVAALFDVDDRHATGVPTDADDCDQSSGRAADVSWSAPRAPRGGVLGALVRSQFAFLSLLWAVHRTNVRLVERVLDEVNIQTLVVLWLSLSTVALVALVAL